ncbi:MAG: hypothetical protein IT204_14450 [Fimbriimonadaceae bacterium]|nr:hypothetical protein [Fimbriimonadaceae bacterium]
MAAVSATPGPPPVGPRPRSRRGGHRLAIGLAFAAGLLAGSASAVWLVHARLQRAVRQPDQAVSTVLRFVERRLELDAAQRQQFTEVVERRRRRIKAIRAEAQPRLEQEVEGLLQELDGVIRPEQLPRWTLCKERLRAWRPALPDADAVAGGPRN